MDWTTVTLVVVLVVVAPYVIGPAAVKQALWFFERPRIEELAEGDARLTPAARAHFEETDAALVPLGFEPGPAFVFRVSQGTYGVTRMYANRRENDGALAAMLFAETPQRIVQKQKHLEFSTDFEGGRSVDTGNSREPSFDVEDGNRFSVRAPDLKRGADLYTLHRAAMKRHGSARKQPLPPGERWYVGALEDSMRRYVARLERAGLVRQAADKTVRLTWKGAVIGAWTNLPPTLWIRRWRVGRSAEELRRQAMM